MAYNKNKVKANRASVNSRLRAQAVAAIKGPAVDTLSAREPAYLYTGLCPDPARKVPPGLREVI